MWQIKRNDVLKQLDIINMVPAKLGVPSSEYFWLHGKGTKLTLSASSYIGGEIILKGIGDWPFKDDFYLDRKMFMPFVTAARELKDKHTFQFERKGKQLVVRHGTRKVVFDSQPHVKGYGNAHKILKQMDSTIPVNEDLKDMLICGKHCAVSDSVVPHIDCVYLQKSSSGVGIRLYSSSTTVMYMGVGKLEDTKLKESIPFPLYLINLLEADGLKKIICAGKYIVLQFEHGIIWQPVSQAAVKNFPLGKFKSYVKKGKNKPITFISSSRRFARLMLRLGYYLQSVRRKDWVVHVNGIKNKRFINVNTSISGVKFYEKIATTDIIPKNFKIEWPLNVLEPVFGHLSRKTKKSGVVVRVDDAHGISYITVGRYWLACPSKQE